VAEISHVDWPSASLPSAAMLAPFGCLAIQFTLVGSDNVCFATSALGWLTYAIGADGEYSIRQIGGSLECHHPHYTWDFFLHPQYTIV
jgi:hypothetical protein